jgi:RND family efflux transporter MFP subunit
LQAANVTPLRERIAPVRLVRKAVVPLALLALLASGCKDQNKFVPPPPAEVGVALPVRQNVLPYLLETGNTEAIDTVDLVARVEGFLTSINYVDGTKAKQGDTLFVVEPTPYEAKYQQAQAQLKVSQAELVLSQADFDRQTTLFRQNVNSLRNLQEAQAKRDTDQANVENAQAGVTLAAVNLAYTRVTAPFDGLVTKHLVSAGELVGQSTATKLASIIQLDPIYVTFNMSEQDVLKVRAGLEGRRLSQEDLQKVPVEIGLMDEADFPHKGFLNYVSPMLDPATGTLQVRALVKNPDRALLPGLFTRVRLPTQFGPRAALLVPSRVIGTNQEGSYLLVVGKDDIVEQRKVTLGQTFGDLRVIETGLGPDDRVVVTGNSRAVPGRKVAAKTVTVPPAP